MFDERETDECNISETYVDTHLFSLDRQISQADDRLDRPSCLDVSLDKI